MKHKPFSRQGYVIPVDSSVLEYIMPTLSANAWKVLTLIILKTDGYRKTDDDISFSQIRDGTGIKSNHTVTKSLAELEGFHYIIVNRSDNQWAMNGYRINRDAEIAVEDTENELSGTKNTPGAKNTPALLGQKMPTHVVVVDSDKLKSVLDSYVADFGELTTGQTSVIRQWLDDDAIDDCWIIAALSQTIATQPKKAFAYLQKMIDVYIANDGPASIEPEALDTEDTDAGDSESKDLENIRQLAEVIKLDMGGDGDKARLGRKLYYEHRDKTLEQIAEMAMSGV